MKMHAKEKIDSVADLLHENGVIGTAARRKFTSSYSMAHLPADGSSRNFFRLLGPAGSLCIGVFPADDSPAALSEAHAAMRIGRHLYSLNIPVPAIVAADEETGLILFEDCGDIRLHDILVEKAPADMLPLEQQKILLRQSVAILARMQCVGVTGFNREWCHDTTEYDRNIMIGRESLYFLQEFWYGLLGGEQCEDIREEFEDIALQAGRGGDVLFLHRDFQCRNIMLAGSDLKIIDFQGGRIGPPGYDLASLLIDPYSGLAEDLREELLDFYLVELHKYLQYDEKTFLRQYLYLALQRNLQILGAFSSLFRKRGKPFFRNYLAPALNQLRLTLEKPELRCYGRLRKIVMRAEDRIEGKL